MKQIAILGSTSHIAQNLIYFFSQLHPDVTLTCFARKKGRGQPYFSFPQHDFDAVINCIGLGDPKKIKDAGASFFRTTEFFDNMVLDYLETHPSTVYIHFSSGAVHAHFQASHINASDYYGIAKLNAEAKHRALSHFSIVDLRVFSFFSRFIDLKAGFLMSELFLSLKTRTPFVTSTQDIKRDFIHPKDLFQLVWACILTPSNCAYDVVSLAPISKHDLLEALKKKYGLHVILQESSVPVGPRQDYYSTVQDSFVLHKPQYTSLEAIEFGLSDD